MSTWCKLGDQPRWTHDETGARLAGYPGSCLAELVDGNVIIHLPTERASQPIGSPLDGLDAAFSWPADHCVIDDGEHVWQLLELTALAVVEAMKHPDFRLDQLKAFSVQSAR